MSGDSFGENGEDCLLASVARLTEARDSFVVAVFGFVALPPGVEFSHGQVTRQFFRNDDDDIYSHLFS